MTMTDRDACSSPPMRSARVWRQRLEHLRGRPGLRDRGARHRGRSTHRAARAEERREFAPPRGDRLHTYDGLRDRELVPLHRPLCPIRAQLLQERAAHRATARSGASAAVLIREKRIDIVHAQHVLTTPGRRRCRPRDWRSGRLHRPRLLAGVLFVGSNPQSGRRRAVSGLLGIPHDSASACEPRAAARRGRSPAADDSVTCGATWPAKASPPAGRRRRNRGRERHDRRRPSQSGRRSSRARASN